MKKLLPAFILCFVFCFMCFIYEPIIMYSTNIYDFWFDIWIMIIPILKIFTIFLILTLLVYVFAYFINKKFDKNLTFYNLLLIIGSIVFIATYIQGNYLIGDLPVLDGNYINWEKYHFQNIITIAIWLGLIVIAIIVAKKKGIENLIKYSKYCILIIFVMLSTSLITTLLTTDALISKDGAIFTNKNINKISKNKNFLILMLDAVDSQVFYKILQDNSEYENYLEDFTYYSNVLGMYPFTRNAVPYILTGVANKNDKEFITYSSNALNSSPLFKELNKDNYNINLFDNDLTWNGNKNFNIANMINAKDAKISTFTFFKQEFKYVLFKYVPYGLKKYSKIEGMDFNYCSEKFLWMLDVAYDNVVNNKLEVVASNQFQFIHTEGAHVPFKFDKDLNVISNGTYEQKVEANLKFVNSFINRLKEENMYNNTVIVIVADHGYYPNYDNLKRMNPILLIKGFNENHKFEITDKPISHSDLQESFIDLLNNKKSNELFSNIKNDRKRIFLEHNLNGMDHLTEYETTGTAWDTTQFKKTGNVYDR